MWLVSRPIVNIMSPAIPVRIPTVVSIVENSRMSPTIVVASPPST